MSKNQKNLIFISIAGSLLMVLFPPFYYSFAVASLEDLDMGYSFILNPPILVDSKIVGIVYITKLLIQLGVLWAISGIFFLGLKDDK